MKRIIKILLGIVGTLLLLMILAAILLPLIFDEEDLKNALAKAVNEQTGRTLTIDGELDLSVFPWLAVEVADMSLSNAPGFGEQPFASIGEARIGVRLLPLLSKQIEIGEVKLDGLALNLAIDQQGKNNWDDLAGDQTEPVEAPEPSEPTSFSTPGVAGLRITDALVDFNNQSTGAHYRLSQFSLVTGELGGSDPIDIELLMLLEDLAAGSSMNVKMATVASLDLDAERYDLAGLVLELTAVSGDLPGGQQSIELRVPALHADMAAQTLNVESWELDLIGIELEGAITAQNIVDNLSYSGRFATSEFSPSELMTSMQLEAPVTADPDVLKRARLSGSIQGDNNRMSLGALEFELDQSRLSGEATVRNFEKLAIEFELSLDEIDIDRYMSPASDAPVEQGQAADVEIPGDILSGLDIEGQFTIGKAVASGLTFTDVVVGILVRNDKLRMNPLSALFYGGGYNGDITLDASGNVPVMSMNERIENVQYQEMAAALLDNPNLSGTANGHATLTGRGATSSELTRSLNGTLALNLADGAYEGINIWYELRKGLAKFKGLEAPAPEPDRTAFSNMHVNAQVRDGVISTDDMAADLPFLGMTGRGNVNFGQGDVDMRFDANIRSTPELNQDAVTADLAGKRIPFRVSGPLADPGISVDWSELLKDQAKDKLLEKLGLDPAQGDGEDTSVEDQLKDKAKDKLKDLFGDG